MVRRTLLNYMRDVFSYPDKNILRWFPGHMGKGMRKMEQKLKTVDCVVEVHDARIPLIGRNPKFKYTVTGLKPHILVLNKRDLAVKGRENEMKEKLAREGFHGVFYTNCKDQFCTGVKKLVPAIKDAICSSNRYNRSEEQDLSVMVIGIPNVGKSSLINALRHKNMKMSRAAAVGAVAGITKSVSTRIKICQDPLIYVLDTPGVLDPHVSDVDTALKLAICSTMQDHLIGVQIIADYLLFYLNKQSNDRYVEYLGLEAPTDNITELLVLTAAKLKKVMKKKSPDGSYKSFPDIDFAAQHFIKGFRNGNFGNVLIE